MQITENQSLKPYNTFGVEVFTRYFSEVVTLTELIDSLKWAEAHQQKILLLNGGSNMLLTKDWDGLTLRMDLKGIEVISEDKDFIWIKVSAGEVWHDFVRWTLEHDYGGLENLSLIPGKAGTAPIQNIGAYGVEIKDMMTELTALNIASLQLWKFTNKDCKFGYRDSIFKNQYKNQFIILDVTFRLTKTNHVLHMDYGAIKDELKELNIAYPTIQDISTAIIHIRTRKLPLPEEIGNSGSFFKNPVIDAIQFEQLKSSFPDIQGHPQDGKVKVAAGWLIEKAGWKGKRIGDAGVHRNQALVLVNHGNATGKDIYDLSEKILQDIQDKFGILLEREVNVI
ncbi:MAG: UDP-N-acetylmuramate dehydrogenase [Weeksellaceae bacterium]